MKIITFIIFFSFIGLNTILAGSLTTQYLRIEFYDSQLPASGSYDILEEFKVYDLTNTQLNATSKFKMGVTSGTSYNWGTTQTFFGPSDGTYHYWQIFDGTVPTGTTNGSSYALTYNQATANRSQMVVQLDATSTIDIGKIEILRNTSQYSWHGQAKIRVYALNTNSNFNWDGTYNLSTLSWTLVADFNDYTLGISSQSFSAPEPTTIMLCIYSIAGIFWKKYQKNNKKLHY